MKVLMVDDEADIRQIGQLALEGVGKYEVQLADSAAAGFEVLKRWRPDVILMDMMMPSMDGLGALAALRKDESLKSIPVVFMTAKVQKHEIQEYLEAGAIGVIEKPFDPMQLAAEVKSVVDRAQKG